MDWTKQFEWATATPRDRAEMVRRHLGSHKISTDKTRELFDLTPEGLAEIAGGAVWKPEHHAHTPGRA